jgi:phospholipid/cholesterol/gamma-HCH transport system ATP-binding protein
VLGICSVVVSHDIHETSVISDHIYIISEGKIVASGTPDQLRDTENPMVHQFVAGQADGPIPFHFPGRDYWQDLDIDRGALWSN